MEIEKIKPFFQVVLFHRDENFTFKKFQVHLEKLFEIENDKFNKKYFKDQLENNKEFFKQNNVYKYFFTCLEEDREHLTLKVVHKKFPTWYDALRQQKKSEEGDKEDSTTTIDHEHLNKEHLLLILYQNEEYILVHSSDEAFFNLLDKNIFDDEEFLLQKMRPSTLKNLYLHRDIEYRSLGIANLFSAGGSAPDAKAYYGRDTSHSLTPALDAGFNLNYFLGSEKFDDNEFEPIGCSTSKSKIWSTWKYDIEKFKKACDELIPNENESDRKNSKLKLLVEPEDNAKMDLNNLVFFYLDYFIPSNSLLILADDQNEQFLNWEVILDDTKKLLKFNLQSNDKELKFDIKIEHNKQDNKINFSYFNDDKLIYVILSDNLKQSKKEPLIEYLNKNINFTMVFEKGLAYRNGTLWKNNRFSIPYEHKKKYLLNWCNVDIKRESDPARSPSKMNILEKVMHEFLNDNQYGNIELVVNDDGSGEIADIIYLSNKRFILVHAKASGGDTPGLRINDVQIVASQLIKNMKYFLPNSYSIKEFKRLASKAPTSYQHLGPEDIQRIIQKALNDDNIKKECWIVQPGIASNKLLIEPENKMHILLNMVDSVCIQNNIEFHLVSS